MASSESMVPCPSCACHARATEIDCPHCGARLRRSDGSISRTAAALLLGLAAASVPMTAVGTGCSDDGQDRGSTSGDDDDTSTDVGAGPAYGVPETSSGIGGAGGAGGQGGVGEGGAGGDATGGAGGIGGAGGDGGKGTGGVGGGPAPAYGVGATSGGGP